jgi:metal-responsive CopG/Arc/MetJ family transcriptional regulator
MPTEKPRFTITVTEEMLKEIDDFRYENRYPTRTQAVNELFRIGINALKIQPKEANTYRNEINDSTVALIKGAANSDIASEPVIDSLTEDEAIALIRERYSNAKKGVG